jgi:hypothetical protein
MPERDNEGHEEPTCAHGLPLHRTLLQGALLPLKLPLAQGAGDYEQLEPAVEACTFRCPCLWPWGSASAESGAEGGLKLLGHATGL